VTLENRPAIPSIGVVFSYNQLLAAFKAQENVYLHLIMYRAAVLNIQSHANYMYLLLQYRVTATEY
jgi:ABC-type lipoprotein export system ATPase subunit